METIRRKITVFTPGKKYSGAVDVPNACFRTTDLLNSNNLYWNDNTEKKFPDVMLMHNAILSIDGVKDFQEFNKAQIRLSNIILFYDDSTGLGCENEKKRMVSLKKRNQQEEKTSIHLITKTRFNSFFDIKGSFSGVFRNKSGQQFVPLTDVTVHEFVNQQDKWKKRPIPLTNNFIGVNINYIETCAFD